MQKPTIIFLNHDIPDNIFKLVSMARITLENYKQKDDAKKMVKEVSACNSYNEALETIKKYVDFQRIDLE